jgi:hypothetical protein
MKLRTGVEAALSQIDEVPDVVRRFIGEEADVDFSR